MRWLLALFLLVTPASAQNVFFPANPGDMIVKGTVGAWTAVPGGPAGCALISNGPSAAPTWQCALPLNFALPPMPTNTVWGNVSGVQASPLPINISQYLNTIDYDIQHPPPSGSTIYKGTDNLWHVAPAATTGWIWTSGGPNSVPQWAPNGAIIAPGAAGTCLTSNGPTVAPSYQACGGGGGGAVTAVFGRTGAVLAQAGDYTVALVTGAAPSASPTFTGVPAAPTPATSINTTQLATTEYVKSNLADASNISGGTLPDARLPNVVAPATVGGSTAIPVITYDAHGRITNSTTASIMGNGTVLLPEQYGAACNDSTDNTVAFGNLATAINAAVQATVVFAPNCTYRVVPSPAGGVQTQLMSLTGLNSLTVNCNGSTIASMGTFAVAGTSVFIWQINASNSVTFNDCKFTQPNYSTLDFTKGTQYIAFNATNNVTIRNMTTTNGIGAVRCTRQFPEARSHNYLISNLQINNTYYGFNAIKCPDNATVAGLFANNPGRSYFPYNVWNHRVQVVSNSNAGSQDVLIANDYDAADTDAFANATRLIRLDYTNTNYPTSAGAGANAYAQIQLGTHAGSAEGQNIVDDIDLNLNVERSDSPSGVLVRITRGSSTTPQNRIVNNVTIRGSYRTNSTVATVMELMTDSDWTGEQVSNVSIRGFLCNVFGGAAAVSVDGRGLVGPFTLENIWGSGACSYARTNMAAANAAGLLYYNRAFLPTAVTVP